MEHDHDHDEHDHSGHDDHETEPVETDHEVEVTEHESAPDYDGGHDHSAHEGETVWEHAWEIFTDPAHIMAELGWTIIQDLLIIGLLYGVVFKKVILPKLRKDIHKEIDAEHGITHKEGK